MSTVEPNRAGSDPERPQSRRRAAATWRKDEVGLGGSVVFAMAGAAPGQTVSIVLGLAGRQRRLRDDPAR